MRTDHVKLALAELEKYGLKGEVSHRSKHLEISWSAPQGERFICCALTPSDWRVPMKVRADIRKLLKADGLEPVEEKPAVSFQKAMSLPKPPLVSTSEREEALKNDVEALTDLVFELQAQIENMRSTIAEVIREQLQSVTVVSRVQFADKAPGPVEQLFATLHEASNPKQTKSELVLSVLSYEYRPRQWIIAEALKLVPTTKQSINQILSKAKREGLVESGLRGMWRLKKND